MTVSGSVTVGSVTSFAAICALVAGYALMPMRVLLLSMAIFNMCWTARGTLAIVRRAEPTGPFATFAAAIFFISAGTAAFQVFAVFGAPNDITRFGSTATLLIGMIAAASLKKQVTHLRKFSRLMQHVGVSYAIAELAAVDPATAELKAEECRRLTAEALAGKRGSGV